ncbi:MAG: Asp-tRNA(Asn)/Glu-tRNA(Gln) amidotransferase subunit GatC [Casimicrobium sp.]
MSVISDAEMEHLKKLARLEMSVDETQAAAKDINNIFDSFAKLQSVDLSSFPEMPRPVPLENVFRDDVAEPGLTQAEAIGVAVEAENGFFKVPRTVE